MTGAVVLKAEPKEECLEKRVWCNHFPKVNEPLPFDSTLEEEYTTAHPNSKKTQIFSVRVPVPISLCPPKLQRQRVQLTFGGCGGMYNYFLGVASYIQDHFELDNVCFSGVSAGCFPAMLLALDVNIKSAFNSLNIDLITEARMLGPVGTWIPLVKRQTLRFLEKNAYEKCNGKLFCSVTEVPKLRNELISSWESNEELVDTLAASGYIPVFSDSMTQKLRGKHYIDGGLTNNWPKPFPEDPAFIMQVWRWRWFNPVWFLKFDDLSHARKLFHAGIEDAMQNRHELEAVLTPKVSN